MLNTMDKNTNSAKMSLRIGAGLVKNRHNGRKELLSSTNGKKNGLSAEKCSSNYTVKFDYFSVL